VTRCHLCCSFWRWSRCNVSCSLRHLQDCYPPSILDRHLFELVNADDVAVFLKPIKEDVQVVAHIWDVFGHASGLITNRAKCAVYPIQCDSIDVAGVMADFQCPVQPFLCKYLSLPLHHKHLRRVDVEPLIDKIANRLPTWRGRFLNRARRLKLLNSVLSSIPTYFLTVFTPAKWMLKKVNKIRRGFLWKGT
jgi:mannosylglycoprotein endo-beta-mannosidase